MTTLNTIIEEEKKGAKESVLETFDDGTIRYCPRDLETKITTATQRAYEAGQSSKDLTTAEQSHISVKQNLDPQPDTEWSEAFDKEWLETGCNSYGVATKGVVKDMFARLLTSRDTYWKERVKKEVKKLSIEPVPEANGDDIDDYMIGYNQALSDLLGKLK